RTGQCLGKGGYPARGSTGGGAQARSDAAKGRAAVAGGARWCTSPPRARRRGPFSRRWSASSAWLVHLRRDPAHPADGRHASRTADDRGPRETLTGDAIGGAGANGGGGRRTDHAVAHRITLTAHGAGCLRPSLGRKMHYLA